MAEGNGKARVRKPRPQSELELMTMRNCLALLQRSGLNMDGRKRVVKFLAMSISADAESQAAQPAPVDPPNQLKVQGAFEDDLPFTND